MPHKDSFLEKTNVSRETLEKYEMWQQLLVKWNKRINLVAKSTLPEFWMRHAVDSWQVTPYLTDNDKTLLDFGSGAGFPGIATAIHNLGKNDTDVTLTESAGKKASFLRTAIRELGLSAKVHGGRIEDLPAFEADVITARAFAPLDRLFYYAEPFVTEKTKLILLKGESVDEELKEASTAWTFSSETIQSLSGSEGCVLLIKNLKRI